MFSLVQCSSDERFANETKSDFSKLKPIIGEQLNRSLRYLLMQYFCTRADDVIKWEAGQHSRIYPHSIYTFKIFDMTTVSLQ